MKKKKFNSKILILFLILTLTSCASFKSSIKGKFITPSIKNYGAERVSVFFIFSHQRQTKGFDAIPKLDNKYQRISGFDDFFQDALNEFSNIKNYSTFTEYASDVNEPKRRALKDSLWQTHDYIIKMKFKREKSFSKYFLGVIASTATVTLLPIPYTNSYSVDVEVFNSAGQLLGNYSRKSSIVKWVQSLLIFMYPFHPEKRKREEIYVEFLHDIFKQIETEKILIKQ
ncbi:hypothetical protein B6I21_04330 [candidate division KSB1 bacterium 4572_119]|nr:MAG: hypothetical protein B6I21_04330 [candidate division KSB1 bacterium 4572_119]